MKKPIFAAVATASLVAVFAQPAAGMQNDFDAAVSDVEHATHAQHTHIPLMAFASFGARLYSFGAVRGLRVADIENVGDDFSQAQFRDLMESRFGDGWSRMVEEREMDTKEFTVIYARPAGKRMELMVGSLENGEISLVNLKLDAHAMQHWLRDPIAHSYNPVTHEHKP